MDGLIESARGLLEAATDSVEAGLGTGDWTIFVGPEGGMQMIAGGEGPPEHLHWSHGARSAWRVSRQGAKVRVEGSSGKQRCMLESAARDGVVRRLLDDVRLYEMEV
ncbi:MAG: hypothetical protein HY858_02270 [Candidatus Solibacter usitatus]|nr:hypothetical protein [Candidatus Solibacter usitatus]